MGVVGEDQARFEVTLDETSGPAELAACDLIPRDGRLALPRRDRVIEKFAAHLGSNAKVLDEDAETGMQKYRYIRTGENHWSMAFTYAWMAVTNSPRVRITRVSLGRRADRMNRSWRRI